ncbi:MAG TPA: hypothetical protein VIC82_07040 [Candidatus Nanopelagicales bacterium]
MSPRRRPRNSVVHPASGELANVKVDGDCTPVLTRQQGAPTRA